MFFKSQWFYIEADLKFIETRSYKIALRIDEKVGMGRVWHSSALMPCLCCRPKALERGGSGPLAVLVHKGVLPARSQGTV